MAIDLQALRRYIDQGERDKTRTARFHSVVLKHPDVFERMDGEERKRSAAILFDRDSYATEINKMIALARQLNAEGYTLRKD
jgi:benzoyl-CoA reductase/2-hydroxyglutaryl-CoA dehydratase subunit BcrC/BadD/HgdB